MTEAVVLDTSCLFAGTKRLRALLKEGSALLTVDLVVFEFAKVMRDEISNADNSGNSRRKTVLENLDARLPTLLRSLRIDVKSPEFALDEVDELYRYLSGGHEPGDALIWLKMKKLGLDTIATEDVLDWKALGAKVVPLA